MTVIAKTTNPGALLESLKKKIRDREITVWSIDSEGDFCHAAEQVKGKCAFRPVILNAALGFDLRWYANVPHTQEASAELHAHAVRMLIVHAGGVATTIEIPN